MSLSPSFSCCVQESRQNPVQEPLLTCTMKVLCRKRGIVQFSITKYNKEAIKKRILAGKGEITVQLVPPI